MEQQDDGITIVRGNLVMIFNEGTIALLPFVLLQLTSGNKQSCWREGGEGIIWGNNWPITAII